MWDRGAQSCLMTKTTWELVKSPDFWALPRGILRRGTWSPESVTLRTPQETHPE